METRIRTRRAGLVPPLAPPPPIHTRRATRNTSQKTPLDESAHTKANRHVTPPNRTTQVATGSSISKVFSSNGLPRRGAPVFNRDMSIASTIATVPPRPDDASEIGEEDRRSRSPSEAFQEDHWTQPQSQDGDMEENEADEEELDQETRINIMLGSISDLAQVTDDLLHRLRITDYNNQVSRGILKIKRNKFVNVREFFEQGHHAPFINLNQLAGAEQGPSTTHHAVQVMAAANVVTALDEIQNIKNGEQPDAGPLLERLDAEFPDIFYLQEPQLTLEARTQHLFALLEVQDHDMDTIYTTIADVFCGELVERQDLSARFANGPFRPLGGPREDSDELCSARIKEILPLAKKIGKGSGIQRIKDHFPLETFLSNLNAWLLKTYDDVMPADTETQPRSTSRRERFYDAEEEIDDSQGDDASQSQSIVRAGPRGQGFSLFRDKESTHFLEPAIVPPPNQQQAEPSAGAPRDYQNHSNHDLLGDPPLSAVSPPRVGGRFITGRERISNVHVEATNEDGNSDEDDDAVFQTDTRPVDRNKRAAMLSALPPSKRPRPSSAQLGERYIIEAASQRPSASMPPPSSMPNPPARPTFDSTSTPPPSSVPNFAALKMEKSLISQKSRQQQHQAYRQRQFWSEHDMLVLLTLVRERQAAWATIENNDSHRFEHPRNQQAYRDKARNLKVDYLMTDAILPPCFDLVALGKKEIDRLIALGKNPYRKEADVDPVTKLPTHTELAFQS